MKKIIKKYDAASEKILKTVDVTEKEFKKLEKNQPLSKLIDNYLGVVYTYHCVKNNRIVF